MQRLIVPRRLALVGAIALGAFALVAVLAAGGGSGAQVAKAADYNAPLCVAHPSLCAEANDPWRWNDYTYVSGHDEPSLLFYSNTAGAGSGPQANSW